MGMELQGLIDRINSEGLQKAETEKTEILKKAEAQAKAIIAKARADAAESLKNAQAEAVKLEQRAKSAVQQAARDIILGLRSELDARLQKLVRASAGTVMTTENMTKIVLELVAQSRDSKQELAVALPKILKQSDIDSLISSLTADLKVKPEIILRSDFAAGLKVGTKGSDLFVDLSDEALTDLICGYVGPRIAELLKS